MSGSLTTDAGGDITGSKTPGERLDYTIDFTNLLAIGDTIANAQWFIPELPTDPNPMAATNVSFTDTTTTAWLSQGADGFWYDVTVQATGTSGEIYQQVISISVEDPLAFGAAYTGVFPNILATIQSLRRDRLMAFLTNFGGGMPIDDEYLLEKLVATEADLQRRLRVYFTPHQMVPQGTNDVTIANLTAANGGLPVVFEPGYDYDPAIFNGDTWGLIELRQRWVSSVQSIVFAYPTQTSQLFTVPTEWVRLENKVGRISLVPVQTALSIPLNAFILQVFGGGRLIPLMLQVSYICGLTNVAQDFPDLLDLIKRGTVLSIIDERYVPSSGSTSADGLSQSISLDIAKTQEGFDKRLAAMKSYLGGIRGMVL